jgi:hypothetical protein
MGSKQLENGYERNGRPDTLQATLDSVVPNHAWVLPDLCCALPSAHEHRQLKLLVTPKIN